MKRILPLLGIALALAACRSTSDLAVVQGFELDRYLGTWYEAARLPHRFEEGLARVTADYTLDGSGSIRVVNRGYDAARDRWASAEAVARPRGDPSVGWLKVSFFRPFYASYKIVHLDQDYTEAIVTGPTRNYLWILVRDPNLPEPELDRLVGIASDLGFETGRIIRVEQRPNP